MHETKKKLDKTGNDINKKTKYIDELKEIQEKFDCQNFKVKELENELNEKNKTIDTLKNNIKDLENENIEIANKANKIFESINKNYNQKIKEIEKLRKELKKKGGYFNNYEENRIETQEKIKKLNRLNDKLNKENKEIEKELNDKNTSLDEYKNELGILDLRYRQKNTRNRKRIK